MGIYGAAVGTLSTYIIVFTITQIVLYKTLGVKTGRILLNIPHLYKEYYFIALREIGRFKLNR